MNWGDKFSLSRTGYLSLAVNMWPNTPMIYHVTKGDILQIRFSQSNEKHENALLQVLQKFGTSTVILKWCFLESGLSKFFVVYNFRNKVAMTIVLFSKCLKFDVDSRQRTKESIKVFGFRDNFILIGDVNISQSWTRYFSLAVSVLWNTPKI